MDVLIVPEAQREIEALRAFKPRAGAWGVLVGHKRGPRYFVEKAVAAGGPGGLPDERLLEALDRIWPGGIVGLVAVRPGAGFRKAVLSPAWYRKVVLEPAGSLRKPVLKARVVEFKRKFFFEPVPLAAAAKERTHE